MASMEIKAICPHCEQTLTYPDQFIGIAAPCPYCKKEVLLSDFERRNSADAEVRSSFKPAKKSSVKRIIHEVLAVPFALVGGAVSLAIVPAVMLLVFWPIVALLALSFWTLGLSHRDLELSWYGVGLLGYAGFRALRIVVTFLLFEAVAIIPYGILFECDRPRLAAFLHWTILLGAMVWWLGFSGCLEPLNDVGASAKERYGRI